MTKEEFQRVGKQMIVAARERFRADAFALCHTDAEREKAIRLETAVGEVSPEEAVHAFRLWLSEQRTCSCVMCSICGGTGDIRLSDGLGHYDTETDPCDNCSHGVVEECDYCLNRREQDEDDDANERI